MSHRIARRAIHSYPDTDNGGGGSGGVILASDGTPLGTITTLNVVGANLQASLAGPPGTGKLNPSLPWADPRDFTLPLDGTDLGLAIGRAYTNYIIPQHGGMIWLFPALGKTLDAQVLMSGNAVGGTTPVADLELKGQGAACLLDLTQNSGIIAKMLITGFSAFETYLHDLAFRGNPLVGADCISVIEYGVAARHRLERTSFYGVQCSADGFGIVRGAAGQVLVKYCQFFGCSALVGIGPLANVGQVYLRGGVFRQEVAYCQWITGDGSGSPAGVFPGYTSKATATPGNWQILVTGDSSSQVGATVWIHDNTFGDFAGGTIRFDPDSGEAPAPDTAINTAVIDDNIFESGAASGNSPNNIAVFVRKTTTVSIKSNQVVLNGHGFQNPPSSAFVDIEDFVRTVRMTENSVMFGWLTIVNGNADGAGAPLESFICENQYGGGWQLTNVTSVRIEGCQPGQSVDVVNAVPTFLDQPVYPLSNAVALSGVASALLRSVQSTPGGSTQGGRLADNAGMNALVADATCTYLRIENSFFTLIDSQAARTEIVTGGVEDVITCNIDAGVQKRVSEVVTYLDFANVPIAGAQDQFIQVEPGCTLHVTAEMEGYDEAAYGALAGAHNTVEGTAVLVGAASTFDTAIAANFNPANDPLLDQVADAAFNGVTPAAVSLVTPGIGSTHSPQLLVRCSNPAATPKSMRVRVRSRKTWDAWHEGLYFKKLGNILVAMGDDTSLLNVGDGNPEPSWFEMLQRDDPAQAVVGRQPIFHPGLGPSALPGLTSNFVAGAEQSLSFDFGAGQNITNGTFVGVWQATGPNQVMLSLSDGLTAARSCCVVTQAGTYDMLRDPGTLGNGATSAQAIDGQFHVVIGTFCQEFAQIFVDGVAGARQNVQWANAGAVNHHVLTLFDYSPNPGAGGGPSSLQYFSFWNQSLFDQTGFAGSVPATSVIGRLQARLKARYGTP